MSKKDSTSSNDGTGPATEFPKVLTDKRAGHATEEERQTRAQRFEEHRRQSLYEGLSDSERERLEHVSSTRTSNYRWAPGEDPHDDDAQPDSGYEYIGLEGPNTPDDQRDISDNERYGAIGKGPDSGVTCFQCKSVHYIIADERTPEDVAATLPDVAWAQANNRPVDPVRVPTAWLLFCPSCKHVVQLRESVVRALRGETVERYA